MTFPTADQPIPTAIGDISIQLSDFIAGTNPEEEPAHQEGEFSVQVLDQNGDVIRVMMGDLVPHLTAARRTALWKFLQELRDKAETEILR